MHTFILKYAFFYPTQTHSSWSTKGVTTVYLGNNTVRCLSEHLTSFAVLVSFRNDSMSSPEKIALSVISYIGCVISITCLLATIICLILFRYVPKCCPKLDIILLKEKLCRNFSGVRKKILFWDSYLN